MLGGTDVATGLAFEGTLKAPAGSTSITSLSTLVSDLIGLGQSQTDAENSVKSAYGIGASVDILTIDPIQATLSADSVESEAGRSVMGTAAQVLNSVIQIASLIVGASAGSISQADAMNSTFAEVASGINAGAAYNLLDPNSVMTLIQTVAGTVDSSPEVSLNDISGIQFTAAELIASVNYETQAVMDSETVSIEFLTDLTQVSIVAQAESSDALSESASTGDNSAVLEVDTNLTALVLAAETVVGEVDGIQGTVYVPTGSSTTLYGYGAVSGFYDYSYGAISNVEQLVIDNSESTYSTNFVDISNQFSSLDALGLVDTGIIYYGSDNNDTFSLQTHYKSYDTGTQFELHLGDGDDYGEGGSLNDLLEGGNGYDHLFGNAGDDILIGGSGVSDSQTGGDGADRFVFNAGDPNGMTTESVFLAMSIKIISLISTLPKEMS